MEELLLLNHGIGADSWESLESQRDQISQSYEISHEYLLERLMLKLKLQYLSHLVWIADSLEKTLMLERLKSGEEDYRG